MSDSIVLGWFVNSLMCVVAVTRVRSISSIGHPHNSARLVLDFPWSFTTTGMVGKRSFGPREDKEDSFGRDVETGVKARPRFRDAVELVIAQRMTHELKKQLMEEIDSSKYKKYRKTKRRILPESKITSFAIAAPSLAIGLWIFAWTIPPRVTHVPWPVSMIGLIMIGFSLNDFSYVLFGYATDSYGQYAASAVSAISLTRTLTDRAVPSIRRRVCAMDAARAARRRRDPASSAQASDVRGAAVLPASSEGTHRGRTLRHVVLHRLLRARVLPCYRPWLAVQHAPYPGACVAPQGQRASECGFPRGADRTAAGGDRRCT